jgi:hypothetical protein
MAERMGTGNEIKKTPRATVLKLSEVRDMFKQGNVTTSIVVQQSADGKREYLKHVFNGSYLYVQLDDVVVTINRSLNNDTKPMMSVAINDNFTPEDRETLLSISTLKQIAFGKFSRTNKKYSGHTSYPMIKVVDHVESINAEGCTTLKKTDITNPYINLSITPKIIREDGTVNDFYATAFYDFRAMLDIKLDELATNERDELRIHTMKTIKVASADELLRLFGTKVRANIVIDASRFMHIQLKECVSGKASVISSGILESLTTPRIGACVNNVFGNLSNSALAILQM